MNRVIKFISGSEYSLSQLFEGDTKIIIPDLQRDYCWGDKAIVDPKSNKATELVSGFVKNLIELFEQERNSIQTMGLIYGYEQPYMHIQICDGQQRLTTLFLLLGVINTKSSGKFNDYLISNEERNDDYEPHLQYAIRESTLYFLSDLTRNLFIENNTLPEGIKSSNWYFDEYDSDASIQSMISAIKHITDVFAEKENLDYTDFGDFILNNLKVLYYDMESRSRGEETYVVINTTGEPLSSTENIKPILLGNYKLTQQQVKEFSDEWEDREEWFWQNRGEDTTADNGLNEFFIWYWQIGLMQEKAWKDGKASTINPRELFVSTPSKIIENPDAKKMDRADIFRSLKNINKYYKALVKLIDFIVKEEGMQKVLLSMSKKKRQEPYKNLSNTSMAWNWLRECDLEIVLPLITLVAEHDNTRILEAFTRRLRRNYYDSLWSKNEDNENSRRYECKMDWRYLIQIIDQTSDDNLLTVDVNALSITKIPNIKLPIWYDEEEQIKAKLRDKGYADFVDQCEDNEYLMGDISPVWQPYREDVLNIENLRDRYSRIEKLRDRYSRIEKLCNVIANNNAAEDYEFANWFRLYRVISGLVSIGHISYCKSHFEGTFFSNKPTMPWWLESKQIDNLLTSNNMLEHIKFYVSSKVKGFIKNPTNHSELIFSWLTLKSIKSSLDQTLLNYYNDRAVSAYKTLSENYILPSENFSWGNTLLGYSYSHAVIPARDESKWNNRINLDSPLYAIKFICDYCNKDNRHITQEDAEEMNKYIETLIEQFLSTYSEPQNTDQ